MRPQSRLGHMGVMLLLWVAAATAQGDACETHAQPPASGAQHFMILAGRTDVFYDRSGPAFVMLIESAPAQVDIGAFGVYADESRQPRFGAVPASTYETFLHEPDTANATMLRLHISAAQYQRVLAVLRTWERRVREGALLYPDIALDNILLVKQATEELNRCSQSITPYALDWGLEDEISEHNAARRVPFEYFKMLRQLNPAQHVVDGAMPAALLVAAASGQPTEAAPIQQSTTKQSPTNGARE